jgi:type I restriction-modification system DNA methylase subunit
MEKEGFVDWGYNFQTPQNVCDYMASMVLVTKGIILEPTAGKGNLVKSLKKYGEVFVPKDFNTMPDQKFDYVVMNPPFTPMKQGYDILYRCMGMSDNIIALMPYLTIINGEKRTNDIFNFGLKSITHLPRSIFKGSRVQTCILEMKKGYKGETIFKQFKSLK